MNIKYKDKQGNFITENQINQVNQYSKAYFDNNILIKEERYYEGKLMGLCYYNINIDHQVIINDNNNSLYKWISIIETEDFNGGYKLKKRFGYSPTGILNGINLELYDNNGELIAFGYSDANGNLEYDRSKKYYWDRNLSPKDEMFECTYREDTGELFELYWNNYYLSNDGQESFALHNTPEDIKTLMTLTGMSQQLAEYYMSPEIIPNF